MKKIFSRWWFWVLVIIVVAVVALIALRPEPVPEYSSATVERGDLIQSVSETGSVVANTEVRYGWETSGRVVDIRKEIGDTVTQGDVIAILENTRQRSAVLEAQARVQSAQAALALRQTGISDEQRQEARTAVDQAKALLAQRQSELEKTRIRVENIVASAETALREAELNLNNTSETNNQSVDDAYADALQVANSAVDAALNALVDLSDIQYTHNSLLSGIFSNDIAEDKARAVFDLVGAENAGKWVSQFIVDREEGVRGDVGALLVSANPDYDAIDRALIDTLAALQSTKTALNTFLTGLNGETDATATEKTTIETDRTAVETARTNIFNAQQIIENARISGNTGGDTKQLAYEKAQQALEHAQEEATQDIASAEALVRVQEAAVAQQEASYDRQIADPRDVDLASLRADVTRVQASLNQAQYDLQKTRLVALSDGIISALDVEIGETISPNQDVVTIISDTYKVEVDIAESDIAKIELGDRVEMTLDAFTDDDVFTGAVMRIDPAQTEISGVIYYQTDILFDVVSSTLVRAGMTANVEIFTERSEDVVFIPQRALLEEDGQIFVRVLTDAATVSYDRRPVETGLRGNNGRIEIMEGLEEGEEIITFLKEDT